MRFDVLNTVLSLGLRDWKRFNELGVFLETSNLIVSFISDRPVLLLLVNEINIQSSAMHMSSPGTFHPKRIAFEWRYFGQVLGICHAVVR